MKSNDMAVYQHNKIDTPICSSYNCGKPCTFKKTKANGKVKWSPYCSRCKQASYGHIKPDGTKVTFAQGVIPYRKGKCSNENQINAIVNLELDWICPTDFSSIPNWAYGLTDIDHKDGNSANNSHDNLQELCKYCHLLKSIKNKDHARKELADARPYGPFQSIVDQGLFKLEDEETEDARISPIIKITETQNKNLGIFKEASS